MGKSREGRNGLSVGRSADFSQESTRVGTTVRLALRQER